MRQVVLDTETTGLEPTQGHRIIEIGCVELVDRKLTGRHYHQYINPDREVDAGAFEVHGIGNEFLAEIVMRLLFIGPGVDDTESFFSFLTFPPLRLTTSFQNVDQLPVSFFRYQNGEPLFFKIFIELIVAA